MVHMHRTGITAVGIAAVVSLKVCAGASREPDVEGVNKDAIGIIWIDRDALVVPVLRIIARVAGLPPAQFLSEPPAEPAINVQVSPPSVLDQTPIWQPLVLPQPPLLFGVMEPTCA